MATQAMLIQETIAGMKQAISRYQCSSDSDDSYLQPTNRGNKLKRKAYLTGDISSRGRIKSKRYNESINHAGYQRNILRRKPIRYDEDGDELDDEDLDDEADARAAEENPYVGIHLEDLLLPLTSAANLPSHLSMSIAYTSPILTNMAQHASEMVHKERRTLASAKRMMTKLRGDEIWLPCGMVYSKTDEGIFNTVRLNNTISAKHLPEAVNGIPSKTTPEKVMDNASLAASRKSPRSEVEPQSAHSPGSSARNQDAVPMNTVTDEDVAINGVRAGAVTEEKTDTIDDEESVNQQEFEEPKDKITDESGTAGTPQASVSVENTLDIDAANTRNRRPSNAENPDDADALMHDNEHSHIKHETCMESNGDRPAGESIAKNEVNHIGSTATSRQATPDIEEVNKEDRGNATENQGEPQPSPRRMRTRAQAQAVNEPTAPSRSETPESSILPDIHPLFIIPDTAIPDRDFGLPAVEAEETRRLLHMYVQKQEEICRGSERLYEGLLRADRQRKTVLKWCKAEGHVGEMSDGEDWYDKEEWGLEGDLEKGQNDEDGDNNVIQGKKTRGRRA